jgi:hypothetical protein
MESNYSRHIFLYAFITELRNIIGTQSDRPENYNAKPGTTVMKKLIAEDEYNIAMQYRIALENRKHEVLITYDGEECLKSYRDADDKFVYEQQQSADPKTFNDDTNNPPLMELS